MNIKELKEEIKDLPDEMEVGDTGHFGEFLEVNWLGVTDANIRRGERALKKIFAINIADAGPEPE